MQVVEVLLDATNAAMINSFVGGSSLEAVRTVPADQTSTDYGSFPGYPTIPLIDLTTMQVLVDDCYYFIGGYQGADTWRACINAHL